MKETVKKLLRNHCPNIAPLRKAMSNHKLREINRYVMPREDIVAGEASVEAQREIVKRYAGLWPALVPKLDAKLKDYVGRCAWVKGRTDQDELRVKVLFACFAYGFLPDEYFVYELENKDMKARRSYISDRELSTFIYEVNDIIDVDVFFDKFKTYSRYRKYYQRAAIRVETRGDWEAFKTFAQTHDVFVIKNVLLSKGDSVEKVVTADTDVGKLFERMVSEGKYIVEECVTQSEPMSKLSLCSVNTVRCITFNTDSGIVVGPCFLKSGRGHSFVDNGGKGGILVGIDSNTGKLNTAGYDEFLTEFFKHPDTGVEFIGYQLPEWDRLMALVKELSAMTPTVKYIGWDFAHTDNGWIVIEGNGSSQIIGPQIVWKRGFKRDVENLIGRKIWNSGE